MNLKLSMQPIPMKLRRKLSDNPFMRKCCWCGVQSGIEWNHAIIYSGRQISEEYAITPLCRKCHRGYSGTIKKDIKDYCEFMAITKGLADLIVKYPKFDWLTRKKYLESKFIKV